MHILKTCLFAFIAIMFANTAGAECEILHDDPKQKDINIGLDNDFIRGCPTDVRKEIDKEQTCYHLSGEDVSEGSETVKEMNKLKCGENINYCNRKKLLDKYAND